MLDSCARIKLIEMCVRAYIVPAFIRIVIKIILLFSSFFQRQGPDWDSTIVEVDVGRKSLVREQFNRTFRTYELMHSGEKPLNCDLCR